ncbi:MAG: hypothetical protein HWD60_01315 [Defluviicoccus sp.]|nr:MAG: hypothetical protein HWD60_01315 [Defluviicoccus sp.]
MDTIYYAENGLLEVATRVVGVVIETGIIETEPDGRWFKLLEDHARYSGLLTLRACDLATIFRRGSAVINFFDSGATAGTVTSSSRQMGSMCVSATLS